MVPVLILLGLFDQSVPSNAVTPAARRITLAAIPSATAKAVQSMDPSDTVDYEIVSTGLLEDGEQFASVEIALLTEAVALGVILNSEPPYQPVEVSNGVVRVWLSLLESEREHKDFAKGVTFNFIFNGVTDSIPPRKYQRTGAIKVIQQ